MTVVFLDANVLVPITLTNVLLTAAEQGLLQVRWSPEVVAEAVRAINQIRPDIPRQAVERRFAAMAEAFDDAVFSADPRVVDTLELPDADDRHVVSRPLSQPKPRPS